MRTLNRPSPFHLPRDVYFANRHNACGLKEIALEYILRNLNDPTVVAGLDVSIHPPNL